MLLISYLCFLNNLIGSIWHGCSMPKLYGSNCCCTTSTWNTSMIKKHTIKASLITLFCSGTQDCHLDHFPGPSISSFKSLRTQLNSQIYGLIYLGFVLPAPISEKKQQAPLFNRHVTQSLRSPWLIEHPLLVHILGNWF